VRARKSAGFALLGVALATACGGPEPARPVAPEGSYEVGEAPYAVGLADLDGDGVPDAVSGNLAGESVSVLRGGQAGRPAWRQDLPAGGAAVAVALGNFDGTGPPDLAAAVRSAPGHVALFFNQGDGHLVSGPRVKLPGTPNDIAAGDLNEDGRQDLVVALREEAIAVILSPDPGEEMSVQRFPLDGCSGEREYGPDGVMLADLNRDGRSEVVVACYDAWSIQVLGLADGKSFRGAPLTVARMQRDTILGAIRKIDPSRAGEPGPLPGGLRKVRVADLDGDGWTDLAAVGDWGLLLLAFGDGISFPEVRSLSTGVDGTNTLVAGDLDNDGRQEIVLTSGHEQAVVILTADDWRRGTPRLRRAGRLPDTPESVVLADLDRDGRLDAVIAAERADAVQFLQGTGDGGFLPFGSTGPEPERVLSPGERE